MGRGYTLFQEESIPTGIDSEIWNQFRNSNLFKNTPSVLSEGRFVYIGKLLKVHIIPEANSLDLTGTYVYWDF